MGCGASTLTDASDAPTANSGGKPREKEVTLTEAMRRSSVGRQNRRARLAVMAETLAADADITPVPKDEKTESFIKEAIKDNLLFVELDDAAKAAIISSMTELVCKKDELVVLAGDDGSKADTFYVIEEGECVVVSSSVRASMATPGVPDEAEGDLEPGANGAPSPRDADVSPTLGPGKCFGDLALLYNTPRQATIKVSSETVKLWVMQRQVYSSVRRKYIDMLQKEKHALISKVPLFDLINESSLNRLIDAFSRETFGIGQRIITAGDIGDKFYVVQEGEVQVLAVDGTPLKVSGKGEYFGELALRSDDVRKATVVCKSQYASCLTLTRNYFEDILGRFDHVWRTQTLREQPILSALTDSQLLSLGASLLEQSFSKGQFIFKKDDEGDTFYIVEEGQLIVIGGSGMELAKLSKGSCFGELALLRSDVRAASVQAVTDCRVLAITRLTFEEAVEGSLQKLQQLWRLNALRHVPLLSPLQETARQQVADALEVKMFYNEDMIMTQGEEGDTFYMLEAGTVSVFDEASGTEYQRLGPGDYFGELALLNSERRRASVKSIGTCTTLQLSREAFNETLGPLKSVLQKRMMERLAQSKGTFHLDLNTFQPLCVLGQGAFGKVFLVRQGKGEDNLYALKMMSKSYVIKVKMQEHVMREKELLLMCEHPNIVRLYCTYRDKRSLFMLLERVCGGELFVYFQKYHIDERDCRFFVGCVVMAFAYMQEAKIAYRDLKPENLLIDSQGYIKVVDFGLAKVLEKGQKTFTTCGTPDYLAPEVMTGHGHNWSVDWWAVGVLIYELLNGRPPFVHHDPMKQMQLILEGRYSLPKSFSTECKDLIKRLLIVNPAKRLGMLSGGANDVKNHPWFKKDNFSFDDVFNRRYVAPWIPDDSWDVDPEVECSRPFEAIKDDATGPFGRF
mmetsp:Transcript_23756/g.77245  ORF Transcript_23756/g.77245 Transcript_23756/m.77245 type:complete len:910 (-) Transcript_23756:1251-3980(-)|eukprot:CAMPEP_0170135556 /NCGR_PEP_ID=MMETSP0033_2-20121228/2539_1 /TAXON_ID=195969 /ORGANISM="Dolichomastix tenuilepis, Strain CCMP3274" /LENGTH=909 /DNA_ID=CAMNT_0010371157 /DNA_START=78 /DNA_END=2807 /DNA_ORIENTATION=+